MTKVRGKLPDGTFRFITAALYDVRLEHEEVPTAAAPKPSLTASLGGFSIEDEGHNFTAVMHLTIESVLPGEENHLVRIAVGVVGQWISAEALTEPISGAEAVDRLFPYAKAYVEQILGQARIDLPPIPDMADVPFSDEEEPSAPEAAEPSTEENPSPASSAAS